MNKTMKHTLVAITAVLLLAPPAALHAAHALPLAASGKALQPIVIAANASEETKAVAKELADYLGSIAGAQFSVQAGDGSRGIVLGTLAEFPNPSLAKPLEIRNGRDGREAFVIRTEPKRLLLIGPTDLGVSHAAFRLLEHLGCRWFFPAREWEVVPRSETLSVSLDESVRPRILSRRIAYGYGFFTDPSRPRHRGAQQDYLDWARHNRMASSLEVAASHAWQAIIIANQKVFNEHPEYLALVGGKRRKPQLCVSNPAVRRLAVEYALGQIEKRPDREMVSMECSDGLNQCECDQCARLGTISDRVFGLANEVARQVAAKYPGKMVGCLAYGEHSPPPSSPLEPNVYVQLTAGFTRGPYSHDELLELWPKKCRNLGFYEYYSVWPWDFDKLPGGKVANVTRLRETIQRYAAAGGASITAESGNNWGVHGRGYYIANRLMWNPDADLSALLTDFYEKAFGPAATAMRRYYERVAPDSEPLMSRGLVGQAFRDVHEAIRLALDRPDVQARLDQLTHYLRYVHLRWLLDHEKDADRQKQLTLAILELVYRTRYEYMNHWAAIRYGFANDAAKQFNEPTWRHDSKTQKPWTNDAPVTKEETAAWFAEGLAYFQPTPVTEVSFAYDDLVPVSFAAGAPAAMTHSFQRPQRYALASPAGQPLAVEITTGLIAGFRDHAPARYTLTDRTGKQIAAATLPLDGESHAVTMKVPSAGTYFFDFNDSAAGWRIKAGPRSLITWLPPRGRTVHPLGSIPELFFYVPKGTRQLQFFYSGGPCRVLGPDRKVIAETSVRDEDVSVPVPPGADGKCWSLAPHGHTQLWFYNAPNCLAASPTGLLLPRALVERDRLP